MEVRLRDNRRIGGGGIVRIQEWNLERWPTCINSV